jgi:hypothetical protein
MEVRETLLWPVDLIRVFTAALSDEHVSILRQSTEKKAGQPEINLPPKLALPLAQSSCSPEYIVKAILGFAWAVAVVIF